MLKPASVLLGLSCRQTQIELTNRIRVAAGVKLTKEPIHRPRRPLESFKIGILQSFKLYLQVEVTTDENGALKFRIA
jgi:hypothetical protein